MGLGRPATLPGARRDSEGPSEPSVGHQRVLQSLSPAGPRVGTDEWQMALACEVRDACDAFDAL